MRLLHPAIVGAVADLDTLSTLPYLAQSTALCDLIEYRIDALFPHQDLLLQRLGDAIRPHLITVRDPAEGGLNGLSHAQRARCLVRFLPHATFLDIEIKNLAAFQDLIAKAHQTGVRILSSHHDLEGTPPARTLLATIEEGRRQGADAVKIATTTRSAADIHTLLSVLEAQRPHGPLAIMGMGPLGMGSRVLFAQCGSLLTYTYLKNANAPGQWSASMMRTLFDEMGIARALPANP